jgi:small subunit ribosomal protein S6
LAHNVYEGMFIFDSNNYARDPSGVSGRVPKMVAQCGGEVLASRLWNEQKLAYPIKGHRKGTYWLTYFRLDSERVTEFRRACQLNDDIVRSMIVKVDPRLVETLVAHARGDVVPRKAEEEPVVAPVPSLRVEEDALDAVGLDPDVIDEEVV